MIINLENLNYGDWIVSIFKNEELQKVSREDIELQYRDHERQLEHIRKLFGDPSELIKNFSLTSIKFGFEIITDGWNRFFSTIITDKTIDLELRNECISASATLFEKLFTKSGFEELAFMWWDVLICDFFGYPTPSKAIDEDGTRLREAFFETLLKILKIENRICQLSALHGLGHLQHPKTKEVIEKYLKVSKSKFFDDLFVLYAQKAITGEMDKMNIKL